MHRTSRNSIALAVVMLILGILACAPFAQVQDADLDLAGSQTMEALDLIVAETLQAVPDDQGGENVSHTVLLSYDSRPLSPQLS